ncbi:DUF4376 domain-containing protein [Prevotella sp.]|uniref:DUF4376 domain-containing protein n=1 Tax=Prevotella sp. TaxID=59823 RepID=UPI003F7D58E3
MTRMIFEQKQPKVVVCKSGRAMIALNEQVVKSVESVPVGMTDEGEMRYEEREKEQYAYDVCWLENVGTEADVLNSAKESVLAAVEAYDTSSAVNGFILNGQRVWLDKATRVGLMNSTTIAKAMGQPTTTLWLGDVKLVVECDKAIQLLSALEMYALKCFNVTAAHKKAVAEMSTVESVLGYDYTADYPKMLEMRI